MGIISIRPCTLPCHPNLAYLERIFAGEALVAMAAREWLDGQVNSLVTLQIVIPVEALWALIATERSVVWWVGLLRMMSVHLRVLRSAVEVGHHAVLHAVSNERHLSARVVHIREDGHLIAIRPVLRILLLLWLWLERRYLTLLIDWRHLRKRPTSTAGALLNRRWPT